MYLTAREYPGPRYLRCPRINRVQTSLVVFQFSFREPCMDCVLCTVNCGVTGVQLYCIYIGSTESDVQCRPPPREHMCSSDLHLGSSALPRTIVRSILDLSGNDRGCLQRGCGHACGCAHSISRQSDLSMSSNVIPALGHCYEWATLGWS